MEKRLSNIRGRTHCAKQNNLSAKCPLELVRIRAGWVNVNHLTAHRTLRRRRPRSCLHPERLRVGRHHPRPRIDLLPAHAELAPVLQVRIRKPNRRQRIARPSIRLRHIRRARQPLPNAIRQRATKLHHFAMLEAFVANALIHREVNILSCRLRTVVRRGRLCLFMLLLVLRSSAKPRRRHHSRH